MLVTVDREGRLCLRQACGLNLSFAFEWCLPFVLFLALELPAPGRAPLVAKSQSPFFQGPFSPDGVVGSSPKEVYDVPPSENFLCIHCGGMNFSQSSKRVSVVD